MEKVTGDAGPLRLPVQPQPAGAVVEMVAADDRVDGRVKFDPSDLRAGKILLVIDVMDVVVFD